MVAVADESYQQFLVHRTGVWTDVLIDGSGVAVTVLGIVLYGKLRRKPVWRSGRMLRTNVENWWLWRFKV